MLPPKQDKLDTLSVTKEDFENAVKAIESATTPEAKQEAISLAETIYGTLYSTVKQGTEVQSALDRLNAQKSALNTPTTNEKTTLESGAIAGIVIGSVAFVCIIVVVAIVLAKKNKGKAK